MIGGENTAKSVRCLAFLGRCVLYGTASGKQPVLDARALYAKCASVHGFWLSPTASRPEVMGPAWAKLNDWITQGHLKPVIGHLMPLEELAEAFRLMLGRKNFGKIVLTVNS
jgi:NADPH2:quinone reductase